MGGRLGAGEDVLERHHAGIDEQQRRVVLRHQRRGRRDRVVGLAEIVEEGAADLVQAGHGRLKRLQASPADRRLALHSAVFGGVETTLDVGVGCWRIKGGLRRRTRSLRACGAPPPEGEDDLSRPLWGGRLRNSQVGASLGRKSPNIDRRPPPSGPAGHLPFRGRTKRNRTPGMGSRRPGDRGRRGGEPRASCKAGTPGRATAAKRLEDP
jgi:hypothetical protein